MNQERFVDELNQISKSFHSQQQNDDNQANNDVFLCNRLYTTLVECLSFESKRVEARLKVLSASLDFYIQLRLRHQAVFPEGDAFGHFLFMECSRLVLGIEFHHLGDDDVNKIAFKNSIVNVYTRLEEYVVGQVFLVLEWLMVNQWSHPTLVAMMKGEEMDKEKALSYIRSGEYLELFRLRVEMLMESGCDNFACNLVGWCVQSPLFEADVQLQATHLQLLHKLGKFSQLQNQCCQLSCCLSKEILKHLASRPMTDDNNFLHYLAHSFLLVDWIKPLNLCCTSSFLSTWLSLQKAKEENDEKFIDSVAKAVSSAQHPRQINLALEVIFELFGRQFIEYLSTLAITCIQKYKQAHLDMIDNNSSGLSHVCQVVAKLYHDHPSIYLSSLVASMVLQPNQDTYLSIEAAYQNYLQIPSPVMLDVNPDTLQLLTTTINSLHPSNVQLSLGWEALSKVLLPMIDKTSTEQQASQLPYLPNNDFFFHQDSFILSEQRYEGYAEENKPHLNDPYIINNFIISGFSENQSQSSHSSFPLKLLGSDGNEKDNDDADNEDNAGDDVGSLHDCIYGPQEANKVGLNNITLDDIQQVLSGPITGNNSKDFPMDERALNEITAFLQSEMEKGDAVRGGNGMEGSLLDNEGGSQNTSQHFGESFASRFLGSSDGFLSGVDDDLITPPPYSSSSFIFNNVPSNSQNLLQLSLSASSKTTSSLSSSSKTAITSPSSLNSQSSSHLTMIQGLDNCHDNLILNNIKSSSNSKSSSRSSSISSNSSAGTSSCKSNSTINESSSDYSSDKLKNKLISICSQNFKNTLPTTPSITTISNFNKISKESTLLSESADLVNKLEKVSKKSKLETNSITHKGIKYDDEIIEDDDSSKKCKIVTRSMQSFTNPINTIAVVATSISSKTTQAVTKSAGDFSMSLANQSSIPSSSSSPIPTKITSSSPQHHNNLFRKATLKCEECGKDFMSKAGRTTHIMRVHKHQNKFSTHSSSTLSQTFSPSSSKSISPLSSNSTNDSSFPCNFKFSSNHIQKGSNNEITIDIPDSNDSKNSTKSNTPVLSYVSSNDDNTVKSSKDDDNEEIKELNEVAISQINKSNVSAFYSLRDKLPESKKLSHSMSMTNSPPEQKLLKRSLTVCDSQVDFQVEAEVKKAKLLVETTPNFNNNNNDKNKTVKDLSGKTMMTENIKISKVFSRNELNEQLVNQINNMKNYDDLTTSSPTSSNFTISSSDTFTKSPATSQCIINNNDNNSITNQLSMQLQKLLQHRIEQQLLQQQKQQLINKSKFNQQQLQQSTSQKISNNSSSETPDQQASVVEMLKLAEHLLKTNIQIKSYNSIINNNNTNNSINTNNKPVNNNNLIYNINPSFLSQVKNSNAINGAAMIDQLKLIDDNQKLLQLINDKISTSPVNNNKLSDEQQLKLLLQLQSNKKADDNETKCMIEQTEFLCESCLLTFSDLSAANQHVSNSDHRSATVTGYHVYCCFSCGVKYRNKNIIKNHISFTCPLRPLQFNTINDFLNNDKAIKTEVEFSGSQKLLNNLNNNNNVSANKLLLEYLRQKRQRLQQSTKALILQQLQQFHLYRQVHKCFQCHKMFSTLKYLNLHILTKHTNHLKLSDQQKTPNLEQPLSVDVSKSENIKVENDAGYGSVTSVTCTTPHLELDQKTLISIKNTAIQNPATHLDIQTQIKQEADTKSVNIDIIRKLISKSQQFSTFTTLNSNANNNHAMTTSFAGKRLLPTPSAVSVLSIDELTRGCKRNAVVIDTEQTCLPNHSSPSMPIVASHNNQVFTPNVLPSSEVNTDTPPKMNLSYSISTLKNPSLISQPQKTSKAKGILYKNVYMQCEGTYYCSVCKADLSSRESKRSHRQLSCGDPKTVTYSRKYFYLCPYCSEKFPSQKECRQHQITECLPMIGISTDELTVKELACPLCPKKYHNLIPLKGHMTQVHHLPKEETRKMLEDLGYLETAFDQQVLNNFNINNTNANASSIGGVLSGSLGTRFGVVLNNNGAIINNTTGFKNKFVQNNNTSAQVNSLIKSSLEVAVNNNNVNTNNNVNKNSNASLVLSSSSIPSSAISSSITTCDSHDKTAINYPPSTSVEGIKNTSVSLLTPSPISNICTTLICNYVDNKCTFGGTKATESLCTTASHTILSTTSFSSLITTSASCLSSNNSVSFSNKTFNSPMKTCQNSSSSIESAITSTTTKSSAAHNKNLQNPKPSEVPSKTIKTPTVLSYTLFECSACKAQFASPDEANAHLASGCDKITKCSPELKRTTVYKCSNCDLTFNKAKSCRQHQLTLCSNISNSNNEHFSRINGENVVEGTEKNTYKIANDGDKKSNTNSSFASKMTSKALPKAYVDSGCVESCENGSKKLPKQLKNPLDDSKISKSMNSFKSASRQTSLKSSPATCATPDPMSGRLRLKRACALKEDSSQKSTSSCSLYDAVDTITNATLASTTSINSSAIIAKVVPIINLLPSTTTGHSSVTSNSTISSKTTNNSSSKQTINNIHHNEALGSPKLKMANEHSEMTCDKPSCHQSHPTDPTTSNIDATTPQSTEFQSSIPAKLTTSTTLNTVTATTTTFMTSRCMTPNKLLVSSFNSKLIESKKRLSSAFKNIKTVKNNHKAS